jgi:tRNA pseudouridine55 synthase
MESILPKVLCLHKPEGSTPLACIERYRFMHPEYVGVKLAYAGRLDPMAEGLLLVLVGDECKKREHYEQCPKTYEITVLLGIGTDSGDILGLVTRYSKQKINVPMNELMHAVSSCHGQRQQRFSTFSSKNVSGHPLYWWARHGRLSEITIPTHEISIYGIDIIGTTAWNTSDGIENIHRRISAVSGNFRQSAIIDCWKDSIREVPDTVPLIKLQVSCSSGTYMREFAAEIGDTLGVPACVYTIVRTQIGFYREGESVY